MKKGASLKGLTKARKAAEPKKVSGEGGLATIMLNAPARIEAQGYKNLLGTTGVGGAVGKTLGGIAKEAAEVGEAPLVAALKGGESLASASKGNTKPGADFLKGLAEGVEHGAAGELLQGHLGGAVKAAKEHPLFTATEAAGVESAVGRPAGALLRGVGSQAEQGGLRGALARAGSTVRPPLALSDDAGLARKGLVKQRTYSKDSIRKADQVIADKRREPVLDAKGTPVTVKDRGRTVPVLKASAHEQEKLQGQRANFEAARTQGVEILEREKARKTANHIEGRIPPVKPAMRLGQELSHLVATGTIRSAQSFKGDLLKRIKTIEDAIAHPEHYRTVGTKASPGELRAAKTNLKMLQKAAASPRILKAAPQIVQNGLKYAEALKKGDTRLGDLHVHPPEELQRAALSEYALAHMGARHYAVPAKSEEARANWAASSSAHDRAAKSYEVLQAARKAVAAEKESVAKGQALMRSLKGEGKDLAAHPLPQLFEQRLSDATDRLKEKQARVVEAEAAHAAAQHDVERTSLDALNSEGGEPALRTPQGELLTNEAIRRHAAQSGRAPESLAYVPHVIGAGRKSSFHRPFRPGGRPVAPGVARTGALFKRGATAVGTDLLREELTKKGVVASNAQAIDKFVGESGLKRPDGQHFNAKEGLETAARLNADGTSQYVPVRAFAAKLDREIREKLAGEQNSSAMETAHEAMLNDRIVTSGDQSKTRNVVLVPKTQVDTLMRHLKPAGEFEKTVQLLNAPFRMAVLPQPRWLAGNFLEPYMVRLPLSGAGVNIPGSAVDMRAATKAIQGMEKSGDANMVRAAQEVRGMQMGGLFIGRRGASVRRTYQDFSGNTARTLYAAHVARNLPVMKQMGDLILTVPHTFFNVNRVIESTAQRIALGKAAREDIQQFTGSWTKTIALGKRSLEEVQKGLVNTSTQHRFMERQYELLGQYDGFKPGLRRAVQTAFPFLPWTLNSLRFVYWTLPGHHSAAFTALVKSAQHVQAEWEAEHKDVPPGTLSDALVQKDKGLVDVGRYTPFGITVPIAHGQAEGLPSTFMPQLSGAQEALSGKDPFGRPLQVPKTASNPKGEATAGQKLGIAANSAAESMIPLLAMGRRLQEGGGTSYANSTIFSPKAKPETSHGMSGVDRTLNPFRPTYVKPKTKAKAKLGSGLSSGLGSGLGTGLK